MIACFREVGFYSHRGMRGGQPPVADKSASRAIATFVRGQETARDTRFPPAAMRPVGDIGSKTSLNFEFASIRCCRISGVHQHDPVVEARETSPISWRSKLDSRSRGTSITSLPVSITTVLRP